MKFPASVAPIEDKQQQQEQQQYLIYASHFSVSDLI